MTSALYRVMTTFIDARFPKQARILESQDFAQVFRRGRRLRKSFLTVHVLRKATGTPRLGISVPKRFVKRAVDRNHVKRSIRESFRQRRAHLHPADIVVVCRGCASASEIEALFVNALSSLSLLTKT